MSVETKLRKLKQPIGRASLADYLLDLSIEAAKLHAMFRYSSALVAFDDADPRVGDAEIQLKDAAAIALDLAIEVNLGKHAIHSADQPKVPSLFDSCVPIEHDQVVEIRMEDDPRTPIAFVETKPPIAVEPAGELLDFEVLDRGPGFPGHITFSARSLPEAIAHARINWPGLKIRRKLPEPTGPKPTVEPLPVLELDVEPPQLATLGPMALAEDEFQPLDPVVNRADAETATSWKDVRPDDWAVCDPKPPSRVVELHAFDVELMSGNSPKGQWITRVMAENFIHAERLAEEMFGVPKIPRKMMAFTATRPRDMTVSTLGGLIDHVTPNGTPVEACVLPNWADLMGDDAIDIIHESADIIPSSGDIPDPGPDIIQPEVAAELSTDDLLIFAANQRPNMAAKWKEMARDGATDLEVRAALGRAFDLGVLGKRGVISEIGGCCCFEGGDLPKFWSGKTNFDGRPTLEGKALIERARRVLSIPLEDGSTLAAEKKPRRKPKLKETA